MMFNNYTMSRLPQNPRNPIQYVRTRIGLSQFEFAHRLGLSRSLVAKLESEQDGYSAVSDRVRRLIAREFGAILQHSGSPHPALDFSQQPYTSVSFEHHAKHGHQEPLADDYPPEALGTALGWVAGAARKCGVAASFHEAIGKSMLRLQKVPSLAEALDKVVSNKDGGLSSSEVIAATWLRQYFSLPTTDQRVPRFVGCDKHGGPLFELHLDPQETTSGRSADPALASNPEP